MGGHLGFTLLCLKPKCFLYLNEMFSLLKRNVFPIISHTLTLRKDGTKLKTISLIFLSLLTLTSTVFSDTLHTQNIPCCQYYLGSNIGPITPKSPNDLPSAKPVPVVPAKDTLWKSSAVGFIPTNDWFEQMAAWPKEKTATNTSGLYCMSWNLEQGGMTFNVPTNFHYIPDTGNPAHGYIVQNLDPGFSIGAARTE